MRRRLFLFKDYRDHFYSSVRQVRASMDIDKLSHYFAQLDVDLIVRRFADIDLRSQSYRDELVVYQSSEDRDLKYKSYIEDLVLAMSLQGARLIPSFAALRAHHNKVFMELLRDLSGWPELQNLRARSFGTLEELLAAKLADGPVVLKRSDGTQGVGVMLARTDEERVRAARALSASPHLVDDAKDLVKVRTRPWHRKVSRHRRKFVVQEFVAGLTHDYKVIGCGSRVYVLRRDVRPADFRASGSGRWQWIEEPLPELFDLAIEAQRVFDVPYASLDIAGDGRAFYIFEFQFLMFGTTTIEKAPCHFVKDGGEWRRHEDGLELEDVMARAVVAFADRKWPVAR